MRVFNWDVSVVGWACEQVGREYEWGVTDCASLVRSLGFVLYDRDLFPEIDLYTTLAGAAKAVASHGQVSAVLRNLGASEHVLACAQVGDVLVQAPDGAHPFEQVSICLGAQVLATHPDTGVTVGSLWSLPATTLALRLPHEL